MAKSLGIRVPDGHDNTNTAVDAAVLSPVTPNGNLGSIVAGILSAEDAAMDVIVDLAGRKVYADTHASGNVATAAALLDANGSDPLGELGQDDDSKKTGTWSRTGSAGYTIMAPAGETQAEKVASRPQKPTYSISTLISAIEDASAAAADSGEFTTDKVVIHASQATGKVTVMAFNTDANKDNALESTVENAAIAFEQFDASASAGVATPFE